jgi:ketosteroid isomerase-like protein
MTRSHRRAVVITVLLGFLGLGLAQNGMDEIPAPILELSERWELYWDTARLADMSAELYAEDAVLMPPNVPSLIGRPSILAYAEALQEAGVTQIDHSVTEGVISGDVGHYATTYTLMLADGTPADVGKALLTIVRVDGTWMIHQQMFNSDLPVSAPGSGAAGGDSGSQ